MFGNKWKQIKIVLGLVAVIATVMITMNAQAMECSGGIGESIDCCRIMDSSSDMTHASLSAAVTAYNKGDNYGRCRKEIIFDVSVVTVNNTHELTFEGNQTLEIIALDTEGGTRINNNARNSQPAFKINGVTAGVDFVGEFKLNSENGGAFLECTSGSKVHIEKLVVQGSEIKNALKFPGCSTISIDELTVLSTFDGDSLVSIEQEDGGNADIYIGTINYEGESLGNGNILQVNNVNKLSVTEISVNGLASGWVAHIGNVQEIESLKVSGSSVSNGVYLTEIGSSLVDAINISLMGKESGIGLKLDQNVQQINFGELTLNRFQNGVSIHDHSNLNTFDTLMSMNNRGYGIIINDQASGNIFQNVVSNVNDICGIYLAGTGVNKVIGNPQLGANGLTSGCPIGGASHWYVEQSSVNIVPTARDGEFGNYAVVSVTRSAAENDATIQIHRNTKTSVANGMDAVSSLELDPIAIASLPDTFYFNNLESEFTAVFVSQYDEIVKLWSGETTTQGNYIREDGNVDPDCYQDPTTGQTFRYVDELNPQNSDADGLFDYQEDKNLNCFVDAGETSPYNADTDGDGLDDFIEVTCWDGKLDPLNINSDGDSLPDGEEDIDGDCDPNDFGKLVDGKYESDPTTAHTDNDGLDDYQERLLGTNPMDEDSDDDGEVDGIDECPLTAGDANCYYAGWTPGRAPMNTDHDGDGIFDGIEDANNNGIWDVGETRADSADTDQDGIPDGVEDFNQNGRVDEFESDPRKNDTDDDCIPDGLEDKNKDGIVTMETGETSPFNTDTDGDGIPDGLLKSGATNSNPFLVAEDWNCNGENDPGETKPWLADTDGDGINDLEDIAPFNRNADAKARFCMEGGVFINGYSDYDADGDGATDEQELFAGGDCTDDAISLESDPLVADTDGDGLNDGQELLCFETNPRDPDTDADGRTDFEELKNSINNCTVMFARGDSDATNFNKTGACGFNIKAKNDATSAVTLTIITLAMALLVALRRKKA